jgi:aconitase A
MINGIGVVGCVIGHRAGAAMLGQPVLLAADVVGFEVACAFA